MATFPREIKWIDVFEESPDYGLVRSTMGNGIERIRKKFTRPIWNLKVKFLCETKDEKKILEDFYKNDLHGGVDFFLFRYPGRDAVYNGRFLEPLTFVAVPSLKIWYVEARIEAI